MTDEETYQEFLDSLTADQLRQLAMISRKGLQERVRRHLLIRGAIKHDHDLMVANMLMKEFEYTPMPFTIPDEISYERWAEKNVWGIRTKY